MGGACHVSRCCLQKINHSVFSYSSGNMTDGSLDILCISARNCMHMFLPLAAVAKWKQYPYKTRPQRRSRNTTLNCSDNDNTWKRGENAQWHNCNIATCYVRDGPCLKQQRSCQQRPPTTTRKRWDRFWVLDFTHHVTIWDAAMAAMRTSRCTSVCIWAVADIDYQNSCRSPFSDVYLGFWGVSRHLSL